MTLVGVLVVLLDVVQRVLGQPLLGHHVRPERLEGLNLQVDRPRADRLHLLGDQELDGRPRVPEVAVVPDPLQVVPGRHLCHRERGDAEEFRHVGPAEQVLPFGERWQVERGEAEGREVPLGGLGVEVRRVHEAARGEDARDVGRGGLGVLLPRFSG
ncbi:hypothetical protein [Limnoglobus roseus]|uniref:hypothetical protein n=1 Tax=Limnoglobus roseus TaxID=2598579 RepID=UPI001FECB636|nr:hypothetical protein [Limnoglobus roseus]